MPITDAVKVSSATCGKILFNGSTFETYCGITISYGFATVRMIIDAGSNPQFILPYSYESYHL